jgi:hypothetical protein
MGRDWTSIYWRGAAFGVLLVAVAISIWRSSQDAAPAPLIAAPPLQASAPPASPDGIALAPADARAVRQSSSPSAWGGPRRGDEPTLSQRVVHYRIQARLDPQAHTITGREQLTWRNRSDRPVKAVYLHLYLNAFENDGSTFLSERRKQGQGFRSDVPIETGKWGRIELRKVQQQGAAVPWLFVHPDAGPQTDRTVVRLDLPVAVPGGSETTLDIEFFDQLPRVIARTGYFDSFHLVAQWFPKLGVLELPGERGAPELRWNVHEFHLHSEFYADFGSFDVSLDVPAEYTVGATGEEVGPPLRDQDRAVHRFVQDDVHDFAWTADKRSGKPLEAIYEGAGSPQVAVRVLYPQEYAASAPPTLQATLDALAYFSKTLGPYPYRTVTAVIPPFNAAEAGGMEYPTFFTTAGYRELTPKTVEAYAVDFVTIHEFGHGYFYGILGSNEFEEPMLDEGLNQFWDSRLLRERDQRIELSTPLLRRLGLGTSLRAIDAERFGAELDEPSDGLGENAWNRLSNRSYGSVYSRTALVMRDLEAQLGSETLERAFRLYFARWKFRHPSAADLRDVLVEASDQPALVDRVFALHIYGVSPVDDRVSSLVSQEELPLLGMSESKGVWTELTSQERGRRVAATREAWKKSHPDAEDDAPGPFPFRTAVVVRRRGAAVPQTLVVEFADGSRETVRWDDDARWKRFVWQKPARAVSAQLDPQSLYSVELDRLDNGRLLKPDRRGSQRLGADAANLIQLALALLTTL